MNIKKLQEALSKEDWTFSQDIYCVCADSSEELKQDLKTLEDLKTCSDKSEMCRYWDSVIMIDLTTFILHIAPLNIEI